MPKRKTGRREIAVSVFKAKCLSLLAEVDRTKQPLRITRRGKAIVEIVPAAPEGDRSWMGSMKGILEIKGDIVSPVIDLDAIEALKK